MNTRAITGRCPSNGTGTAPSRERSRVAVAMDTLVTVQVNAARPAGESDAAIDRALDWFGQVERICSRFDPESELVRLCARPGVAVAVSDLLFQVIVFARSVAELTGGAFDPTVGGAQQARGFRRNYITGIETDGVAAPATYRDIELDPARRTIRLRRPLLLDLGAVAKGFAIDLAAQELAGFERFSVEAGGDLFAGGADDGAASWRVGIRHPERDALIGTLTLRNQAVCTSGGSERPAAGDGEHHLLDPRSGHSPGALASVTVVAPTALVADSLATAVFILGPAAGRRLLTEQGLAGVLVSARNEVCYLPGRRGGVSWRPSQD